MEEEKEWQESEVDGDHESFEKAALVRRSSGVSAHVLGHCVCVNVWWSAG